VGPALDVTVQSRCVNAHSIEIVAPALGDAGFDQRSRWLSEG